MKRAKILVMTLVAVFSCLAGAVKVSADTVLQSMTVSPTSEHMVLVPGESYTGYVEVSNYNSSIRDLKYAVEVGSFSQVKTDDSKDDYGVVDHVSTSSYNQIMDWITLGKDSGTVAPNETDTVSYTINVPENAPAGGQYATIIVRDETGVSDDAGGNVAIQSVYQFATVIFAEVAGETKEEGVIESNTIPGIVFGGPITGTSMVRNNGNVHTDARYTFEVWPLFGDEEVYTNVESPDTNLILPETERYNVESWDQTPMVGIFKAKQTVEIFGETSVVEKLVLVCPLWLMLLIIFIIVAIIVWIILRARARKKENRA